jgi:hypothetical protein
MVCESETSPKFNHAYDIGFEIVSDTEQATDVTGEMLRVALIARIESMDNKELLQTCNCFDTHEVDV